MVTQVPVTNPITRPLTEQMVDAAFTVMDTPEKIQAFQRLTGIRASGQFDTRTLAAINQLTTSGVTYTNSARPNVTFRLTDANTYEINGIKNSLDALNEMAKNNNGVVPDTLAAKANIIHLQTWVNVTGNNAANIPVTGILNDVTRNAARERITASFENIGIDPTTMSRLRAFGNGAQNFGESVVNGTGDILQASAPVVAFDIAKDVISGVPLAQAAETRMRDANNTLTAIAQGLGDMVQETVALGTTVAVTAVANNVGLGGLITPKNVLDLYGRISGGINETTDPLMGPIPVGKEDARMAASVIWGFVIPVPGMGAASGAANAAKTGLRIGEELVEGAAATTAARNAFTRAAAAPEPAALVAPKANPVRLRSETPGARNDFTPRDPMRGRGLGEPQFNPNRDTVMAIEGNPSGPSGSTGGGSAFSNVRDSRAIANPTNTAGDGASPGLVDGSGRPMARAPQPAVAQPQPAAAQPQPAAAQPQPVAAQPQAEQLATIQNQFQQQAQQPWYAPLTQDLRDIVKGNKRLAGTLTGIYLGFIAMPWDGSTSGGFFNGTIPSLMGRGQLPIVSIPGTDVRTTQPFIEGEKTLADSISGRETAEKTELEASKGQQDQARELAVSQTFTTLRNGTPEQKNHIIDLVLNKPELVEHGLISSDLQSRDPDIRLKVANALFSENSSETIALRTYVFGDLSIPDAEFSIQKVQEVLGAAQGTAAKSAIDAATAGVDAQYGYPAQQR